MRSRRHFLRTSGWLGGILLGPALLGQSSRLEEIDYGDVDLAPGPAQSQFEETQAVLISLNEDSLLKPWRLRAGLPAPGPDLGGWYDETPLHKTESGGHGFAPAHSFGQWISALARGCAIRRDRTTREKLDRLLALYRPTISGDFYRNFRFPAYNFDKLVIGLIDAHQFAQSSDALHLLDLTTNAAEPHLPPQALDRDEPQRHWRATIGESTSDDYTWDESYTLPENLYLAWQRGAGDRYRALAQRFLLDRTYFDPLSENHNVLPRHHAYSFCNALSSAMQAYFCDQSQKHFRAAKNAFFMLQETQSFATGGWGPNESFVTPDSGELLRSVTETHRGFETPCGSYAHFKLTRYLLRATRDGRYGDSMERVLYNTVLGAKPLLADGHAFYYSDYHRPGEKTYFPDAWPCCSGTLPQVAADYRILIYFRDGRDGILVNLYLPSTLRWMNHDGAQITIRQSGSYPVTGNIKLHIDCSRASDFSVSLRVPGWSETQSRRLKVNGREMQFSVSNGFASLRRTWQSGDEIELHLEMPLRLEAIEPRQPNTVALVCGPLTLFAMAADPPVLGREQLLRAKQVAGQSVWRMDAAGKALEFRPFQNIEGAEYSLYLNLRT